ncbi:two-component system response regulator [bacterium CG1_02_42_9]|uniref:Two-component system response regulator n=1 Tax=candidate division WWE3 bacterium CG_4_10_14_0_2_um_filter_42_8 TaxID=1975074 RepID=A0A2M7TB21_UNCKA|nr:MAG: two-component system response regulator [bacterium CG1_02_42_9]PIZ42223.1 MAG: two-component system response regulator [candidate division WWE3 bacterium CG_4_10_14_0_2_um_filter_42_8]
MAKILIADDSAFMRSVLKNILAKEGYNDTIEAVDGVDALKKIEEEKADLLLLDIIMPNLDGIGVLKKIPAGKIKAIVISAVGQEKMMNEAKSLGAVDFIIKPFDAENVLEAVKKVLG